MNTNINIITGALVVSSAAANAQIVQITLSGNQINSSTGDSLYADLTGDAVDDVSFKNILGTTRNRGGHSYFADNYTIGLIRGAISMVHTAYFTTRSIYNSANQTTQSEKYLKSITNEISLYMEGSASLPGKFHHLAGMDDQYGFVNIGDYNEGSNSVFPDNPSVAVITPIVFQDERINGGENTKGYLEMVLFGSTVSSNPEVREGSFKLSRLIFDESDADRPDNVAVTDGAYQEWTAQAVPEPSSVALLALGAGGILLRRKREG